MSLPPSVNLFLHRVCNLRCSFCYSTFRDVSGQLTLGQLEELIRLLADAEIDKLTFVGGEPTLHPAIGDCLTAAHQLGMTTAIITNGARLPLILCSHRSVIDWVGLSLDSIDNNVEEKLGRGKGYVDQVLRMVRLVKAWGVKLKLNTVVTSMSWEEDMGPLVHEIRPDRWKGFQVLPVPGQNDKVVNDLLISDEQFEAWTERHRHLGLIAETNQLMTRSYALIDPLGRFYVGGTQGHIYSEPILEVGVHEAWASLPFRPDRYEARGGLYDWRHG